MAISVEGIIAIISCITIFVITVLKIISSVCYQSKCTRIKCFCMEIERNVNIEQANINFDDNNNIQQQHSTTAQQHPEIHISIDKSPASVLRTIEKEEK